MGQTTGRYAGREGGPALTAHRDTDPADIAAAIEATVGALTLALGRAEEAIMPRVSVSQLRALLLIERHGRTNLNQLAEELGAIPSSASRLCDRLVAAGLVLRRTGSSDRREVELSVSGDGRRLVEHLRRSRRDELATVLARMTPDGRRALLAGLREFHRVAGQRPECDRSNGDVA